MKSIHVRRLESRVSRTAARLVEHATREQLAVADLPSVKLPWYAIREQADGGDAAEPATVFIYDEIGGSLGISASQFAEDLEAITAPEIHVRINSPGGSAFDSIAIYNSLNHHPARIVVYVDSMAASGASVIAMAGDEVVMMPGSQMMIHDASNLLDGTAEEHRQDGIFLDRQSDNVAGLYQLRGGGDTTEWRELMLAETWMFAHEAVEMGLADRVQERPEPAPEVDDQMTRSFDLSRYGYRYAGRREAPAPARRRQATTRGIAQTVRSEEKRMPAVTTPRPVSEAEWRAAAQRRAEGAQQAGYRQRHDRGQATPPAGKARSLPFAAHLRATLETRNGRELYHLTGQASVFDVRYEMWDEFGPYWEEVDPNAGDDSLAAGPDVAFLTNHRGITMARTTNDTLQLAATTGIDVDAWVNPKRQDVSDLVVAIEDKNVTEMSFAFMLEDGWWNQDFTVFRIMRFNIDRGDVSAVNYGANPYTSIAARQRDIFADLDRMPIGVARAAMIRLARRGDVADLAASIHETPPVVPAVSRTEPDGVSITLGEAYLAELES